MVSTFATPHAGHVKIDSRTGVGSDIYSTTPGWISASVHRSRDGTRVVNYAQSESLEAATRIIDRLRAGGWLDRNKSLGEAHPGLYEVVFTLER